MCYFHSYIYDAKATFFLVTRKGCSKTSAVGMLFDKPGIDHVTYRIEKWAWHKTPSAERGAARELWTALPPFPTLPTYHRSEKVVKNITTTILVKFKARLNIGPARREGDEHAGWPL